MPREIISPKPDEMVQVGWGIDTRVTLGVALKADSLYIDLNRDQINRLIKFLRKARDQAYGADE